MENFFKTLRVLIECLAVCFVAYLVYRYASEGESAAVESRLAKQLEVVFSVWPDRLSNDQREALAKTLIDKYDPANDNLNSSKSGGATLKLEDILAESGIDANGKKQDKGFSPQPPAPAKKEEPPKTSW